MAKTEARTYCDVCGHGDYRNDWATCAECATEADSPEYLAWWEALLMEMREDGCDVKGIDRLDWLWYYRDGYSPREALDEDYAAAGEGET
ncbi:MAG TPA: hypothetical protein VD930_13840 [Gemmatimonadales bacterium]|nr:hypothetical protein [Gemmatimonadales bacterium]